VEKVVGQTAFLDKLRTVLGRDLSVMEQLDSRTGFSYKISVDGQLMLLKAIAYNEDDAIVCNRVRSLQKEVQILKKLPNFTDNVYVTSGELDSNFWLLCRWLDATPSFPYCSYVRMKPLSHDHKRRFINDLTTMLKKVMEFYEQGYLHGDLQPRHFLADREGRFYLIDLELAIEKDELNPEYHGALIHFVSPETAKGMLAGNTHISLDMVSEVYSFGSVAFFLYTGKTAIAYGESMEEDNFHLPKEQNLSTIIQGQTRSFAQSGSEAFPELEQVLLKCLATDRSMRYQTFEELLSALEKI
jgi:serine/threonine protein kinase